MAVKITVMGVICVFFSVFSFVPAVSVFERHTYYIIKESEHNSDQITQTAHRIFASEIVLRVLSFLCFSVIALLNIIICIIDWKFKFKIYHWHKPHKINCDENQKNTQFGLIIRTYFLKYVLIRHTYI